LTYQITLHINLDFVSGKGVENAIAYVCTKYENYQTSIFREIVR